MLRFLYSASLLILAAAAQSRAQPPTSTEKNNYGSPDAWLCRPGRQDACAVDLTTTIVAADGKRTPESWAADPNAPIDCFYVYPTVSQDTSPNSDMIAGDDERNVIRQQFARFASVCRPFAPLYRQVTLPALRAALTANTALGLDRGLGYNDVRNAWEHYLTHDNQGRGVVLIGHSQGSMVLTALARSQIDGTPTQSRIISLILLGTNLTVPRGKDVGGAFRTIPLCRSADQIGCVISYAAFRSTVPPPDNTLFGRVRGEGMESACTNPAALGGGNGTLHAYLSADGRMLGSATPREHHWVTGEPVATPFVSVPALLAARCVSNENGSYLEITLRAEPNDPRADDIPGDIVAGGRVLANWGLHLIDVNLAMGNLVDIVRTQSKAYLAKASR